MHMGDRIKEERERLGFNQSDFAALGAATRKTLFNWETGVAAPNAVVLAAWAAHGLDVLYVVTGQRMAAAPAPAEGEEITEGDRILLRNFHASPAQVQEGVKTTLGAFGDERGGYYERPVRKRA